MIELAEIREKLELTNEAMARLAQNLREEPDKPGLIANMNSLRIIHKRLEDDFADAARRLGVRVCSYRLFPEGTDRQSMMGIGKAMVNFQSWLSVVYDAVKRGQPKETMALSNDVLNETMLDFAYSFPGSVGVVLTIPSRDTILGEHFEETIDVIAQMSKSHTANDLKKYSRKLGVAPIKAMYRWADELVESDLGADIEWSGKTAERKRLLIQKPELTALRAVIGATSDERSEIYTKTGTMEGFDVKAHSFHFEYKGEKGRVISVFGKYNEAIESALPLPVKVPGKYKVTIQKSVRTKYSTEEDDTKELLLKLEQA